MSSGPTSEEVRAAAAFLKAQGLPTDLLPPRRVAAAAKEMGRSLSETLDYLAELEMGGQGLGPAPIAQKIAEAAGA